MCVCTHNFVCVCVCVVTVVTVVLYRSMLEAFVADELRAADRTFSRSKAVIM